MTRLHDILHGLQCMHCAAYLNKCTRVSLAVTVCQWQEAHGYVWTNARSSVVDGEYMSRRKSCNVSKILLLEWPSAIAISS